MAIVKDLDGNRLNLASAFIDFLAELFERQHYPVIERELKVGNIRPDMVIERNRDERIVVELKLHRSERVALSLVRNAFEQVVRMMREIKAQRGIIVITQPLSPSHWDSLRDTVINPEQFDIELWDVNRLVQEAIPYPDLNAKLSDLMRGLRVGAERRPEEPEGLFVAAAPAGVPARGAGAKIAEKLHGVAPGRKNDAPTKYEELCEEALKLLFGADFVGWRRQNDIGDGFQRIDLVARLVPTQNRFWSTVGDDFRARYVVFEFKNYSEPITQDQIYTTEKYLFTKALRSIGIIVARSGASESARKAMRGALREQGKLILCVSLAELTTMLRKFDDGDDPTDLLYDQLDETLMTIAR